MTIHPDCDRARLLLMASLDGEPEGELAGPREHASSCPACREWLSGVESLTARFEGIRYARPDVDLWAAVQQRLQPSAPGVQARQLWPLAAVLVAWRALQLFVDLPQPALHAVVPVAAAAALVWWLGGHLLRIETLAPELQKRGL